MSNNATERDDKAQEQEQEHRDSPQMISNDFTKEDKISSPTNHITNDDAHNSSNSTVDTIDKQTQNISNDNGTRNKSKSQSSSKDSKHDKHSSDHRRHEKARSSSNHRSRRKKHHRSRRKYNSRSPSRSYSRSRSHSRSHSRSRSPMSSSSRSRSRSRSASASYSSHSHSNRRTRSRDQLSIHNPSAHCGSGSRHTANRRIHRQRPRVKRRLPSNEMPQESTYANALKGSSGRTYNIFVKNLPRTCQKKDLRALFSRFGEIYSCAVIKRKKNPSTKCFGFVNFATDEAQEKAVRASGKIHMNDSVIECEVSSNVTVVYMGNLPLDASKSDVRYHVRTYGGCYKSIHIRHGHCFIVYDSYYAAEKAIHSLQNTSINGASVWVAIASETKAKMLSNCSEIPAQRSLFIGNLAISVKEEELRDIFIKYGDLTSVRIPRVHGNNKPRGFAFVEFENSGDAELALRGETGKILHSQKLDVDWCRDSHGNVGNNMAMSRNYGGYKFNNNNRQSMHIHGAVQFMPQLDAKTLDSLPVMEVEPGKFVKVIPASFMQSTQIHPAPARQQRRNNVMNQQPPPHLFNPHNNYHNNMNSNIASGRRARRMSRVKHQHHHHHHHSNNKKASVSRSRSRSRSRSNSRKRHRSRRSHRSRHKSSKHSNSDHRKTNNTRHRNKKDGEERKKSRKHKRSKSEEKRRRSRTRSRSRSHSSRSRSPRSRSRTRSRSRSRSNSLNRGEKSESRSRSRSRSNSKSPSNGFKLHSKHRSNSCDNLEISNAKKNKSQTKDKEEDKDNDIKMEQDLPNGKEKEKSNGDTTTTTTTTTTLNDAKHDMTS